jgi:hypothetical protein
MSGAREVCFLICEGEVIGWSDASDDPSALPDSRERWEAIWSRRETLAEIAHSHPYGPAAFSNEDETTMAALVTALARPIRFSVVAPRKVVVRSYGPPGEDGSPPEREERIVEGDDEPWWTDLLRLASGVRRSHDGEGGS